MAGAGSRSVGAFNVTLKSLSLVRPSFRTSRSNRRRISALCVSPSRALSNALPAWSKVKLSAWKSAADQEPAAFRLR
jgi:hypothetical protein